LLLVHSFFLLYGPHLDLHSFPTRRSSDLLVVTEEDDETIYLRTLEEFIHHNLVLRQGPVPATAAFSYRVRSPEDLDKAVAWFSEDRKSTRLNSSHVKISYAVFCLKKKNKK